MNDFEIRNKVNGFLHQGKKIEAIKFVRETLSISLLEAKDVVELAEKELKASGLYHPPTATRNSPVFIFSIFAFIGVIFLAVATGIYWKDYKNTKNSISTPGVVTKLNYQGNGTAPVVEYMWQGEKRIYSGDVFSSPSAFEVGETVEMLVNVDNPYVVVINQVTERYLLVIVFGFMGVVFAFIGGLGMKLNGVF